MMHYDIAEDCLNTPTDFVLIYIFVFVVYNESEHLF